ncbi:MAG: MFS transporter [Solirubrobacteraceae bacterium]|nr:MFS transporter [Solirubrobacteraceae bacterium]
MTADERAEVDRLVSGRGAGPYRWVVLGVGALGAGAFAALRMGLPSLGPAIRDTYGLTLGQVGLAFSALAVGTMVTLLLWGMLTDRIGERPVMVAGLMGAAVALVGAGLATGFGGFLLALFAAGAMGASATGASGRAIMGWFGWRERGMALGIRQMALPLGGGIGSLTLPALAAGVGGLRLAFFVLAGLMLGAALACLVFMREAPERPQVIKPAPSTPPMKDRRLWRLGAGSALLVFAQSAMLGFLVLFLHDERGVRPELAALGLAAVLLVGAAGRVWAGRVSDRQARRIAPMRRRALVGGGLLLALAALTTAPMAIVVPLALAAGVSTMTWNGLAFTAAAEISGRARAGTAMSMQNTIVAIGGALSPAVFGAAVETVGWAPAYVALAAGPLAAYLVLAPLVGEEDRRVAQRTARLRRSASLNTHPEPASAR